MELTSRIVPRRDSLKIFYAQAKDEPMEPGQSMAAFSWLDRPQGWSGYLLRDLRRLPQPGRKRREALFRPQDSHRQDNHRLGLDRARSPHDGVGWLDWGRADHMLKAEQVDFDIGYGRCSRSDFVLPNLVLRKPEVAVRWATRRIKLEPRQPVTTGVARRWRGVTDTDPGGSRSPTGASYQDTKRKLSLDGTVSTAGGQGRRPARPSCLAEQDRNQPVTVHFIGGSA